MPTLDIAPGRNMDAAVALFFGAMLTGKVKIAALIENMTPEQLAQEPPGFSNSIAALVVHLTGIEIAVGHHFMGKPVPEALSAEFLGNVVPRNPLPQPVGETEASLLARLEKGRRYAEEGCRAITLADLDREVVFRPPDRTASYRWMLQLLATHPALHCGHMQMIRRHLGLR